jgi:predicted DNA-binding transcriptional regulator AlpA
LAELVAVLPRLADAMARQAQTAATVRRIDNRLMLRIDEVAAAIGVSRRVLERERSAGRFPGPDKVVGKMPLWSVATVRAWVQGGGRQ